MKGGEQAERARLQRLMAAGLATNALAGLRMNTWQPTSNGRGRAVAQGLLTAKPDGEYECTGVNHFKFAFGTNRQKPGEKVQFRDVAAYRLWP